MTSLDLIFLLIFQICHGLLILTELDFKSKVIHMVCELDIKALTTL